MSRFPRILGADWLGVGLVVLFGGGAAAFRQLAIVPRASVGICAAANPPGYCLPRGWVLHLQYLQAFGWAALIFGLLAFVFGRRLAGALAIGIGVAAVVNYNATMGVVGAALGLVAWLGLATGRYERSA